MAQIIVRANIVVPNGPKFAFNRTLDVKAYDQIDVTVPAPPDANATDMEVELPSSASGLNFIAIMSDWFGADLSYKINKKSSTTTRVLDQPHLLTGKGAASLFSDPKPDKLFFTNSASGPKAKPANIQILIGR
jgi:hypothetical protein